MQGLAGTDVIAKGFDQVAQRAAVTEAPPPTTPNRFVSEDPSGAVIVDEPDLAPLIDLHAGVTIGDLVEEETPAVGADDPDCLVDVFDSLVLQSEFVFYGHKRSSAI